MKYIRSNVALALSSVLLCSCGGGGGSSGPHTVSVKVSGLVGSRLALQLNGSNSGTAIGPAGNGSYSSLFSNIPSGTSYNITVATQPTTPSQTCIVQNGSGTISDSDITNVEVVCTTNPARFLYTPVFGANSISGFAIDASSGALTPISGSPFADQAQPVAMAVDSAGSYAYVANVNGTQGDLAVFTIDRGNGALSHYSDVDLGVDVPFSVAVDPSGKFVFATAQPAACTAGASPACTPHIYGFAADHGTLKPIQGSPFAAMTGELGSVVVDPLERFVYANSDYGTYVLKLNTDTGSASVTAGSPFGNARVNVFTPSGKYVYAAGNGPDGYVVDGNTGALTYAPGFPSGGSNHGYTAAAIDPLGKYLYFLHIYSDAIVFGTIDPSTGAVSEAPQSQVVIPATASGVSVGLAAIDPLGQFMYIMNVPPGDSVWGFHQFPLPFPPPSSYKGGISVYKIDRNTGALTQISGSPFAAQNPVGSIVISN